MAGILIPKKEIWTRQPTVLSGLDYSNTLSTELAAVLAPWLQADPITGRPYSKTGLTSTSGQTRPSKLGQAFKMDYNGTVISSTYQKTINTFTVATLIESLAGFGNVYVNNKGGSEYGLGSWLARSTSIQAFLFRIYDSTQTDILSADGTLIENAPVMLVGTYDGTYGRLYINGELAGGPTAATFSRSALRVMRVGADPGNYCRGHNNYLTTLHARCLTADEVCRYYWNPWQIFAPQEKRVLISLGSGESGVTINTTPALASATGVNTLVSTDLTISTEVGTVAASGLTANLSSEITLATSVANGISTGLDANITSEITLQTGVAAGVASGPGATITTDAGTLNCGVGIGASSSINATITSEISISTGVGAGVATGLGSNVISEQSISCSIAAALATGLPANPISEVTVQTGYAHGSGFGLPATFVEVEQIPLTQEQLDQALAYIKANPMILTIPKYIALKGSL